MMRSITTLNLDLERLQIPLSVYSSVDDEKVSFRSICHTCLKPINQKKVCNVCNKEVNEADLLKGFEMGKENFVVFNKEEIKKISSDLISFVGKKHLSELPIRAFKGKHYFLGIAKASKKSEEARLNTYARVLEGFKNYLLENDIGFLVRFFIRDSENIGFIHNSEGVLVLSSLYLASELRSNEELQKTGLLPLSDKEKAVLNEQFYLLSNNEKYEILENEQNKLLMTAIEVRSKEGFMPDFSKKAEPKKEEVGGGILELFA